MITDTAASNSANRTLCTSITAKGRSCRYRVSNPGSSHCAVHSRPLPLRHAPAEANPLADLPPELSSFRSYTDITQFLARVLTLLSQNRISPRRAAVLSYIANSIVNSLRAADRLAQYEAAHQPEEEFRMDFSSMIASPADSPQPPVERDELPAPTSLAPAAPAEPPSPSVNAPAPASPQPPSATPPDTACGASSGACPAQLAPAVGSRLPQSIVAPNEPYNYWKDPKYFPNPLT